MKFCAFAVYDSKAKVYSQPFYAVNTAVATRMFEESCNDRTQAFYKFPEDFTLFEVGEFDDAIGLLTSKAPLSLGLASRFRKD